MGAPDRDPFGGRPAPGGPNSLGCGPARVCSGLMPAEKTGMGVETFALGESFGCRNEGTNLMKPFKEGNKNTRQKIRALKLVSKSGFIGS
jgi:hypothetical protein